MGARSIPISSFVIKLRSRSAPATRSFRWPRVMMTARIEEVYVVLCSSDLWSDSIAARSSEFFDGASRMISAMPPRTSRRT